MCGIAGSISPRASEDVVRRMIGAIEHRGPDDRGFFALDGLALGMCRLAIQDLSPAGHQPMTSAEGRYTIIFNGEIYNVRELQDELKKSGAVFHGNSDTEVVLEAYARWGSSSLDRLRGMWALSVYDRERRELLLSRDPFGIKPLYVYDDGKLLTFSSELKGLLAHPDVLRELNPDAVRDMLLLGYALAPRTILKNVRALLPGEQVIYTLSPREEGLPAGRQVGVRDSFINRLGVDPSRATTPPSDQDLLAALDDSVRHHLIADVPVGLFYSGGLDSATLTLILKRIGADLTAYHVAIEGRPDTPYAREIAKILGVRIVEVPFSQNDVPRLLDRFWQVMDAPLADTGLFPTMLVADRAVQDVKVVLAGEGGDELFAGYDRHARFFNNPSHCYADQHSSTAEQVARQTLRRVPGLIRWLSKIQGVLRWSAARRGDQVGSFFSETAIAAGVVGDQSARRAILSRFASRETPDGPLAPDRLVYLPDDLLAKTDVATMAASLEARVPFLDRELFSMVGAAPMSWKRAGGQSKAPLRRILESAGVPRNLLDRPKAGFSIPLTTYILNYERERVRAAISWYRATFTGLEPSLDAVLTQPYDVLTRVLGYTLYALLTVYVFNETRLNSKA